MQTQIQLVRIFQTIISISIIYLSWGSDAPIYNFALCFGGCLLGHVITDVLYEKEED